MIVNARCTHAGPLGKPMPTRSSAAILWARLHQRVMVRLRW
ncbi:hypothetical protein RBA41_23570 [Massilia sp. CCM 9210]|nr:hypothetical protein [Massilia sp. CCM 9210]MDQ1816284.1 hypothetical protein [Massilia sp. CCM 9210]